MIIYNVTCSMEKNLADEWLHWMKSEHLPEVLEMIQGRVNGRWRRMKKVSQPWFYSSMTESSTPTPYPTKKRKRI